MQNDNNNNNNYYCHESNDNNNSNKNKGNTELFETNYCTIIEPETSKRCQPPPRRSVSFHKDKPTFSSTRATFCLYRQTRVQMFLPSVGNPRLLVRKRASNKFSTKPPAAASAMKKKKNTTKRKSTTKKKSKVHSVNALNQLLDLETEHDDGRGLECFTKSGKLRRQMCVKMAKCAVLQYQKKAPTTTTSCVAQAYQKETKHARDQALVRGRLYSRKQQHSLLFFEDDDDDDQSVQSLRSVQSTQSMRSTKSTKSYATSASTLSSSRRQQQRRRQLLGKKKTRRG